MIPSQLWTYRARLERVVDGDTVDVTADAGFRNYRRERLRLLGVNAPEMHGDSHVAGEAAREFVKAWLTEFPPADWPLIITTEKADAFGRFLATVWRTDDGACLNEALLASGHAVPFAGRSA